MNDNIENILKSLLEREAESMNKFFLENPECFEKSRPYWLYPRLVTFFQNRPNNPEVNDLLNKLGNELVLQSQIGIYPELKQINKSLSLDESFVEDFIKIFNNNLSKKTKFQKIKSPYKTISYSIAVKTIDKNILRNLAMQFAEYEHPFILNEIATCYISSADFSEAFGYLYRASKKITTYPNKYWNSVYGVIGATNTFINLYKMVNDVDHKIKLFKLCYLYLTRLICISKDKNLLCDAYNNRAHICLNKLSVYAMPKLGINPDLLYISDLWYAYFFGLDILPGEMPLDYLKKSMTMYQNASIYVNDTGGYIDIEDRTYNQIVEDKQAQSYYIAFDYLELFRESKIAYARPELNDLFQYIEKEYRYDYENFKNRVLNLKK